MKKTREDAQSNWRWNRNLILFWCLLAGALGFVNSAVGENSVPLEHKVKAACLFNFAVNTEWPAEAFADAKAPVVFGLVGDVPFASVLQRGVEEKTVQGRKIEVRSITLNEASKCHVVFVAPTQMPAYDAIERAVGSGPILLVGESAGFAQRIGIINFVKVEGSVKFEVNLAAANRAKLKLGSQLLKLAIMVKDGRRE
jgi:hypothetical protein